VRGARFLTPFTRDRDFIIFEQRGTRYADPNLQCPEVNDALHSAREQNLTDKKARAFEVRAAKACRNRLVKQGVDLSQYDSAASAADMEDLRRALGIGKWNLYGVSYSTRLMMNYIREYGANVRSVILDSVLPPSVNYDETSTEGVLRSFDLLVAACRRDPKCNEKYPDLKQKLFEVISEANKKPITLNGTVQAKTYHVELNGNAVFDFVYNMLEDTGVLSDIPRLIFDIANGNHGVLKPYVENNLTSEGFIWGARYSVWCREEMPFQDRRRIAGQASFPGINGFQIQGALPGICKVWDVPAAGRVENEPVKSDVPALVFGGEFDPDTPTAWSRMAASWFNRGYFFEAKNTSHGVLFSSRCANVEIVPAFLKDPATRPAANCLETIPLDFK
jgi:pimeloyl-ACP methyl ester carboxylesterase